MDIIAILAKCRKAICHTVSSVYYRPTKSDNHIEHSRANRRNEEHHEQQ